MTVKIRVEYDDNQVDVVDKINQALKEYGSDLEFVTDDKARDGFQPYVLTTRGTSVEDVESL